MLIDSDITFDTVGLLNTICRHPPLKPKPGGLSIFEFVILANIVALAWRQHRRNVHVPSMAAGKKAIREERAVLSDSAKLRARAYDPNFDFNDRIRETGSSAYEKARQEELQRVPDEIDLTLTRSALLKAAGFSTKGPNLARLGDVLDRLCKPIDIDGVKRRLLWDWRTLRSGKLRLVVNGRWIPRKRFTLVLLPLPTNTRSRALPLFLLMHVLGWKRGTKMSLKELCDTLGIAMGRWDADARRTVEHAVKAVNAHLERNRKRFEAGASKYFPGEIAVCWVGDYAQFVDKSADRRRAEHNYEAMRADADEAAAEAKAEDEKQREAEAEKRREAEHPTFEEYEAKRQQRSRRAQFERDELADRLKKVFENDTE